MSVGKARVAGTGGGVARVQVYIAQGGMFQPGSKCYCSAEVSYTTRVSFFMLFILCFY